MDTEGLRLKSVTHLIDKTSWATTLDLEEDVKESGEEA